MIGSSYGIHGITEKVMNIRILERVSNSRVCKLARAFARAPGVGRKYTGPVRRYGTVHLESQQV